MSPFLFVIFGSLLAILTIGLLTLSYSFFRLVHKDELAERAFGTIFGVFIAAFAVGSAMATFNCFSHTYEWIGSEVVIEEAHIVRIDHQSSSTDWSDGFDNKRSTSLWSVIIVDSHPDKKFEVRGWSDWKVGQKVRLEKQVYDGRTIGMTISGL